MSKRRPRCRVISMVGGNVDASEWLPLIDAPQVQKLGRKRQLGMCGNMIFRSATHTRLVHSLDVFKRTRRRTKRWRKCGYITRREARATNVVGFLHDIGHMAGSHDLEELCDQDHNDWGLYILGELQDYIEQCRADYELVRELFARMKNPLHLAVSHNPLGTDKMAYLLMDARFARTSGRPPVELLLHYVNWIDGTLVADIKVLSETIQMQRFYLHMYERVYMRKLAQIAQGYMQKLMREKLRPLEGAPELTEESLWRMDDFELDASLRGSAIPMVRDGYEALISRRFPKLTITLRPERFYREERVEGKSIKSIPVPDELFSHPLLENPWKQRELELELASRLGVPFEDFLAVPALRPERFVPKDIPIYDCTRPLGMLSALRPAHFASLEETAQSYRAIRFCVTDPHRERLATERSAELVRDYLMETLSLPSA